MAFFDEFGKMVSEAGQKTLQKTKEMSDVGRLNSLIAEQEKLIEKQYCEIGKLYAVLHRNDCETDFSGMMNVLIGAEERICSYQKEIQDVKGVCICENCGAEVPKDVAFCSACGVAMPRIARLNQEELVVCPKCGGVVKKGMRFCTSCGNPIENFWDRESSENVSV